MNVHGVRPSPVGDGHVPAGRVVDGRLVSYGALVLQKDVEALSALGERSAQGIAPKVADRPPDLQALVDDPDGARVARVHRRVGDVRHRRAAEHEEHQEHA